MASVKYPIPSNYIVTEMNGLQGLIRRDKRGNKWLWEPFYRFICVGKSYGKILVAYVPATGGIDSPDGVPDFMRIASYNQKEHINARVYDVLFGENFLYIKTDRGNGVEWALVSPDLSGGKFIGNFELANRGTSIKFHVPIGTTEVKVLIKDPKTGEEVCKILKLTTGELVNEASEIKIERKAIVEPQITHYDMIVGAEGSKIKLLNSDTKAIVKESQAIGEIEQYIGLFGLMFGETERIPKEVGDKFIAFTKRFEVMVNGSVIPVLYEYVKERNPGANISQILDGMLKELDEGWSKGPDGEQYKCYTEGPVILILKKVKSGIILAAPYLIRSDGDDEVISEENIEALRACYRANGFESSQLKIVSIDCAATVTDENQLKHWPLPYSVLHRANLSQVIGRYTYACLEVYQVKCKIASDNGMEHGDLMLTVVACENLRYKPKSSATRGQTQSWVKTNISGLQIL